jgi:hypothetical protein
MRIVIEELEELLKSCELDGEEDGDFANQLRKAIEILREAN